ncbi:abnormal GONad development family member (gon-4) [Sphingobacterium deserti]|uniref:Abnormal GONad development family member (Gon-4) n=2 Tax=Sphingobacterium deserti TaxID=1229276 RepID=A0A0B8T064_9SPHI|nr:abnormal GONad development family member (gon-4) [Sphingobacterium deserti]
MKKKKRKTVLVDRYERYEDIGEMFSTSCRNMELSVPSNLRMICAILDVNVETILYDYKWIVCCTFTGEATRKQRRAAQAFFIARGYGQKSYSKKQIKQMFGELENELKIFKTTDKMSDEELGLFWKNNHMYGEYWFKRWFNVNTRKDDIGVLQKY